MPTTLTVEEFVVKIVEMLTEEFGFTPGEDYIVDAKVVGIDTSVYIPREKVGIKIDFSLSVYEIHTVYAGQHTFVKVGFDEYSHHDLLVGRLARQLKSIGVRNSHKIETGDEDTGW